MKSSPITFSSLSYWAMVLICLVLMSACSKEDPYTIHFVNYRGRTPVDAGFEKYLKDKNVPVNIVYHDVDRKPDSIPAIVAQIKADKTTDLVVTWGTIATLGVFGEYSEKDDKYINDVPGIFAFVTDPVASKIIDFNDTGRHITGSWQLPPVVSQFSTMMIHKPGKKIGILYTPTESNSVATKETLQEVAGKWRIEFVEVPFEITDGKPSVANVKENLQKMKAEGVEWLYLGPDNFLIAQAKNLVIPEAHRLGIITFGTTESLMQAGAAYGLVSLYFESGLAAGQHAEKILVHKVPPQKIPVSAMSKFQHQINSRALKDLGLKVSPVLINDVVDVSQKEPVK